MRRTCAGLGGGGVVRERVFGAGVDGCDDCDDCADVARV
jgi:hypothetical protein